jgi:hypothetical protein
LCQPVQSSQTFLVAFFRKIQNVVKVNAALIAHFVMSHDTGIQEFDEERTRHSKYISRSLRRNHLVIRNESDGSAVRHEPHRFSENLEHAAGKFNSFPGRADHGGYAAM